MGRGDNAKYDRKEVLRILDKIGFIPDVDVKGGGYKGKGDHVVYVHKEYNDIKLTVPMSASHRMLTENEMSSICDVVIIAMKVLGMDTSIFKRKEGIEGKFMKAAQKSEEALFNRYIRTCLGLNDDEAVREYISRVKAQHQKACKKRASVKM